ncbi:MULTISPECIES: exopolysaccharide Pel transporter PelG [Pontibacillus]|uniref:Exopolysaccharide Pel transporter PelG n=1 Tax=Pontibacillus chungwhensis TaxID=265426 RepID=A0ABY8V117_9BACI|nr:MULTISPECIES: exopolysaccharide Pel transporter PelG [Pontibacillus]MCD5324517.1 exopolysaccharide Pel transporter PelG [Pontibacillus sp. HN14]WIF99188.1 exopolysaccharide Pel transporter PelG [Pontibacillus chungwhensis]
MAGIGFKLQKLFQEDYYSSRLKAYAFAGLVSSGPWLIVITAITLIQWLSSRLTGIELAERELFTLSVAYCFIFSQVILGIQHLIVTRYVADLFYEKIYDRIFPTFLGVSKVTLLFSLTVWVAFAFYSPLHLGYKLVLLTLFIAINLIWVMFIFLSAAKYYQAVAYSFLIGGVVGVLSILLIPFVPENLGLSMSLLMLLGFTLGMVLTLFGLMYAMLITFPNRNRENQFSYLKYYDRYPALFGAGFLYNAGIWVCNWIIWFGEGGSVVAGTFLTNRLYDTAIFWSYLTIIPTLIIFVVSVETRFYERYRTFYGFVNQGGTYEQIGRAQNKMNHVLRQEMARLFRSQGVVSFVAILLSAWLVAWAGLDREIGEIFRITTIGAFSNAMVLVITLLLLYFDDQKGAVLTSALFYTLNGLFTFLLLPKGIDWYGISFALGSTAAFLFAGARLIYFLREVDYYTFCRPAERDGGDWFERVGERLNRIRVL